MFYKPQSLNPNKHPSMPNEYPWITSDVNTDADFIEITPEDYATLISGIDLTSYNLAIQSEHNLAQQTAQREFGLYLIPEMIDLMGERNLTLSQNGSTINIISLASDNSSVKLLIETGALKTARSICSQLKLKYTTHADIYDHVIEDITEFLAMNGYE